MPEAQLSGPLRKALGSGRFERLETRAVEMHLKADDRVLDLGAGAGLIALHCAHRVGPDHVVCVEPNPAMAPVIQSNLSRNGFAPVTLVSAAVVPSSGPKQVALYLHGGFWAASLDRRDTARETSVSVPTVSLEQLIDAHDPTVLIADLEGAEADVLTEPLSGNIRLVVLELHPKRYPPAVVGRIFAAMAASGLAYCPEGSQGKVVVFERVFSNG